MITKVNSLRNVYREYPSQFWLVVGASFIDRLGGAMLFPFFTLYLTKKFGINMTTVGVLFGLFSLSSVFGMMAGGALTDRLGRKRMLLFGLVMSALSSVLMGVIDQIGWFVVATFFYGLVAGLMTTWFNPWSRAASRTLYVPSTFVLMSGGGVSLGL